MYPLIRSLYLLNTKVDYYCCKLSPILTPTPPPSANRDELLREKEKPDRNEQQGYYNTQNEVFGWPCFSERPWEDTVTCFQNALR